MDMRLHRSHRRIESGRRRFAFCLIEFPALCFHLWCVGLVQYHNNRLSCWISNSEIIQYAINETITIFDEAWFSSKRMWGARRRATVPLRFVGPVIRRRRTPCLAVGRGRTMLDLTSGFLRGSSVEFRTGYMGNPCAATHGRPIDD